MIVFVSGPLLSSGLPWDNVHEAVKIADRLVDAGYTPFVPHLFAFWAAISPKPESDWKEMDLEMLERCDAVYRYGGDSAGADEEMAHAKKWDIPVVYNMEQLADVRMNQVISAFVSRRDAAANATCGEAAVKPTAAAGDPAPS